MNKIAMFVFNGDPMCFIHVLLNAIDIGDKGGEGKIVIEGAATKLIPKLAKSSNPMAGLWKKALDGGLVEGVCKACSNKMGTLEDAKAQGLPLLDEMSGHPSMAAYRNAGWEIITF